MKYLKILVLVVAMAALMCVSALAAPSVTVTENGAENSYSWTYDASVSGVTAGEQYLLLVLSDGDASSITADKILYIDQAQAVAGATDSDPATVTFPTFTPKNYCGGTALFAGNGITTGEATQTVTDYGGLKGDVTCDKQVKANDILKLRALVAGNAISTGEKQTYNSDVNSDGNIKNSDTLKLRQVIAGNATV